MDALDEEYGGQLNQRDGELQQIESELEHATKELETTRKDLEARQTQSQRLVEAQQRFRNLQAALQTEWDRMTTTPVDTITALDELDDTQDVDASFAPSQDDSDEKTQSSPNEPLTHRVKILRARIAAYKQNDQDLRAEVEEQRAQSAEKELQCKKLIAACCNLPIEKIDDLVEPLILAIESDPPDLDLARVIGFMEKIRRQGAFSDSLTSSQSSSPPPSASTAAMPTAAPTPPSTSGHHTTTSTTLPPVSPREPVGIPNDHPSTPNSNVTEQY